MTRAKVLFRSNQALTFATNINNRHTGAEADRVGAAVRGCFALFDAGGFLLNDWYSAARTVTRIPRPRLSTYVDNLCMGGG